jgi:CheY-like chemotaxis protein
MMRLTLEAAGHDVEEAQDGETALQKFGDGRDWAAVLLDQKLPGLDGLETMRRMKALAPDACIIMVTAFASIDLAVDAMRLGATDFLRKPMTPEMLRGAVGAALASRPRVPLKGRGVPPDAPPRIETLTLNGFSIVRPRTPPALESAEHVFEVTHFPDGARTQVSVRIDPEAVARVGRLSRRDLRPGGSFWRGQAERLLSAYLWTEDRIPEHGLTVTDVSREDLDVAAVWQSD